jgi:tyrosine-protein kinase Etk/Wzc
METYNNTPKNGEGNGQHSIDPRDTPKWRVSDPDPHVLDYFTLVARHRVAVIVFTLLSGAILFGYTLFCEQTFKATAVVIPPEKQQMNGMLSFLSGSGALDILKAAENPALDLFKNVLDSRSLSEEIAQDPFVYSYFKSWDTGRANIAGMAQNILTAEPLRNSMMTVMVEIPTHWNPRESEKDSAKKLSAYLANLYVKKLDQFNRNRLITVARNTREYVEAAYAGRMKQLDSTYAQLQDFQQQNKTISLTDQLTTTVSAAASMMAQVQQLEMQLAVEERELQPNSNRLSLLKAQLQEARASLGRLEDGSAGDYAVALNKAPALTRKLAGFTREVKLLEQMTAYLRQQLEQEKINEQRNVPTLQMLDSAVAPLRKATPHRFSMLLLGLFVGFVVSLGYVSFQTYILRVKRNRSEHRKLLNFVQALRFGQKANLDVAAGPDALRTVGSKTENVAR